MPQRLVYRADEFNQYDQMIRNDLPYIFFFARKKAYTETKLHVLVTLYPSKNFIGLNWTQVKTLYITRWYQLHNSKTRFNPRKWHSLTMAPSKPKFKIHGKKFLTYINVFSRMPMVRLELETPRLLTECSSHWAEQLKSYCWEGVEFIQLVYCIIIASSCVQVLLGWEVNHSWEMINI